MAIYVGKEEKQGEFKQNSIAHSSQKKLFPTPMTGFKSNLSKTCFYPAVK